VLPSIRVDYIAFVHKQIISTNRLGVKILQKESLVCNMPSYDRAIKWHSTYYHVNTKNTGYISRRTLFPSKKYHDQAKSGSSLPIQGYHYQDGIVRIRVHQNKPMVKAMTNPKTKMFYRHIITG